MSSSARRRLGRPTTAVGVVVSTWLVVAPASQPAQADTPLVSATVRTVPARHGALPDVDADGATRTVSFGAGVDLRLGSVAAELGTLDEVAPPAQVRMRRVPDACTRADRQTVWFGPYDETAGALAVGGSFSPTMEEALADPLVDDGVDNPLTNDPSAASCNDVERIDLLHAASQVESPAEDGYLVLERGGNDAFGIAAVTAVDRHGDPTSFGPLHAASADGWGRIGALDLSSVVLRHDGPPSRWRLTGALPRQPVAGRFVSAADLGLAAGKTVYGVAIVAADVAAGTDLLDPAAFPRDTGEAAGGLDLIGTALMTARARDAHPPRAAVALTERSAVRDVDGDGVDAGDAVATTFVVANTGDAVLRDIAVGRERGGSVTCARTTLAPGRSTTCATVPDRLTQRDLDSGHVDDAAIVRAQAAAGTPDAGDGAAPADVVTARSSIRVMLAQRPGMAVGRSITRSTGGIVQRFTLRNTGNVTLTGLGVRMGSTRATTCPVDRLPPGASTTCQVVVRDRASRDAGHQRPRGEAGREEARVDGRE